MLCGVGLILNRIRHSKQIHSKVFVLQKQVLWRIIVYQILISEKKIIAKVNKWPEL